MNIAERLPGVEYAGLGGLTPASIAAIAASKPGYTRERGAHFLRFRSRIDAELLNHRVITDNRYTAWFSKGEQTEAQLRAFVVQFSVFSNQFLLAQLNKMVNADTLEGMRASKEILANELGVTFNKIPQNRASPTPRPAELDPDHVEIEGSVQGGVFQIGRASCRERV